MDTRVFNPQSPDKIFVKELQCELQYCASGSSEIRPLGNPRCANRRPRPNQRARSDRRCFMGMWRKAPSVENDNQKHLLTLSKSLMQKNIKWLSQEDLSISDNGSEKNDNLSTSRYPKCPWQGSIPDDASATLSQQDGCGVPPLNYLKAEEESQSGLDCLSLDSASPYSYSSSPRSFKYQPSSHHDSSGTLTPGSDVISSPEASSDKSFSSMVSSPSNTSETIISSPSFTICREASVEGLFIEQTPQNSFCSTEEESVCTDSHQSPFRRQVFTSLITRQSAMVRKVSQQTCRIMETLKTVAAVSDPDLEAELVEHVQRANSYSAGSTNSIQLDKMVETSCLVQGNETLCQEELYQGLEAENDHGIIISLTPSPEVIEADSSKMKEDNVMGSVPRERSCFRFLSMSDSGVEWESDDEGRSLSRGSSTSSEDGMTAITEEQELLCGNRVSQMTKTYNDIDAVTRLLQEKEKDLELAAKIGQQLLNRNKALEERNATLDAELSAAGDKITQLTHNLQMKTELLQIYTNDVDDTSSCETTPTGLRVMNVDFLQHRVRNLEDENKSLRLEATQLATDTQECEEKEKELVTDVIKQLSDANLQVRQLNDDLAKKVEDSLRQQEEITQLLAQVVDLQSRNKRLAVENDELHNMVGVARDCQQELTMELAELKEKYAEVLDLLHDTQDQLRRVQKKNVPGSRGHHLGGGSLYSSPFNSGNDSIASELQNLNSIGEESSKGSSNTMRRTFDTVRLSGRYTMAGSQGSLSSLGYGGSLHSTPTHHPHTPSHMSYLGSRGSSIYSGGSGHPSLDSGADSDASLHTDSEDNYPGSHLGVPGWPGTPDLDSCLRRLGPGDRSGTPSHYLPYGCRTPDSIMSTGSGKSGVNDWKLPQKLQIVKPIEGSLTLSQWSRLATPNLAGLLEEREGVAIKGGAGIEQLKLDVYSMSDLEEDEPEEEHPGKRFMCTSGVFTYTNSTILHPDDQTTSTRSLQQAQVSVLPAPTTHPTTTTPSTPIRAPSCPPSRRGSTATFSTNTGLAKVLNERGMHQQSGYSPTATPANTPTNSKPGSPEHEGYKLPGLEDLTKTFYYGASLLRRTFYKNDPSAPQSPSGPRVNLVEQVQAIGVDRFVGSGQVLSVGGVVTSRPATSPLLHLSNLIMSSAKDSTSTATCTTSTTATSSAGMFVPKVLSPGERRPTLPSGAPMGIPGHPGSGHLDNRLSQLKPGQRADLGTVGGRSRPTSLGTVPPRSSGMEQNVGTVCWTSFGRKGGLL
ncbi:trafficking kinesin-binding protein 1 isoform X5 [Palaemon carinicauda]|uniref:trafficking kinesin-binding protein 1 isoform X5 n=1 Tax=Palaemon carinicauda TaxID=392227 RepID=UPI0035B5A25F